MCIFIATEKQSVKSQFIIEGDELLSTILLRTHVGVSGSILQVHTLPDPTPMPTEFPHTAEHDGRYSDGIHNMFLPSYFIHMPSELRLVPRYMGRLGSTTAASLEVPELCIAIVPISVQRRELMESKHRP
jgi:hypothetical protein